MPGLLDASALNPLGTTATKREVTNDELTSYQTNKLLNKDSAIRQTSEAAGRNYAAGRGLLNSDMGGKATFGAFVDRVTPIAAADAGAYGGAADKNMAAENEFKMADKNYGFNALLQKDDQSWRSGENTLDRNLTTSENQKGRDFDMSMQTNDQKWKSGESALDRTQQAAMIDKQQSWTGQQNAMDRGLTEQDMQSRERMAGDEAANKLLEMGYQLQIDTTKLNQGSITNLNTMAFDRISAIQADPDLTPEAKEIAIENTMDALNNMVGVLTKAGQTALDGLPSIPTAPYDKTNASRILIQEAAKYGYLTPSQEQINAAIEYAAANNLSDDQMRAYVRSEMQRLGVGNVPGAQTTVQQGVEQSSPIPDKPFSSGSRAIRVMKEEAARLGYPNPTSRQINNALNYASENNLSENEMREFVRNELGK